MAKQKKPEVTTHETPSGETYTTPKLKVPEKKPQQPVERLTKEEAEKWAGVHYAERDPQDVEMFQSMRTMIDAIPTPTRDDGSVLGEFSAFSLIKDVLHGSLNLMEAPEIGAVQPEWIMKNALDMAPTSAVAGAATMPKGAFGMFGSKPGPNASPEIQARWQDLLSTAKRLDQDLIDPVEIHKQTGMSKDHGGGWVYEVPNDDVRIDVNKMSELNDTYEAIASGDPAAKGGVMMLDEVVDLPDVYAHWPELKETFITVDNSTGHVASYNPTSKTITLNLDRIYGPDAADDADVKTIVHEIQHALQWLQGRKGGSSPEKSNEWMTKSVEVVEKVARRALANQGEFTPAQKNALMRTKRTMEAWKKMQDVWGEKRAAYKMDPGEIEADLSEGLVSHPGQIKMHPDDPTRRAQAGVPAREFQASPDDMHFPAAEPTDKLGITKGRMAGGKTFGKRGVEPQLSDKGSEPDFTGVPLGPGTRKSVERAQQRMDETQARLKQSRLAYAKLNEELGKLRGQEGTSPEVDAKIAGLENNLRLIGNQMDLEERIIKGDEDLIGTFIDENVDSSVRALTAIDSPDLEHLNKADKALVLEFGSQQQRNYEGIDRAREQIRSLQNKVNEAKSQAIRNELSDMIEDNLDRIERRMERIAQNDEFIQRVLDRVNRRDPASQAADRGQRPDDIPELPE